MFKTGMFNVDEEEEEFLIEMKFDIERGRTVQVVAAAAACRLGNLPAKEQRLQKVVQACETYTTSLPLVLDQHIENRSSRQQRRRLYMLCQRSLLT